MKATTKRSIQLYEQLSGKAQASLVFNLLAEQNADEAHRVHESAKWIYGRFKDPDYSEWSQRMTNVALLCGIRYWQLAAQRNAAMIVIAESDDDAELPIACVKAIGQRMQAIKKALSDLCDQHGFDYQAALKLADIPEGEPSQDYDEGFYSSWRKDMLECLPA